MVFPGTNKDQVRPGHDSFTFLPPHISSFFSKEKENDAAVEESFESYGQAPAALTFCLPQLYEKKETLWQKGQDSRPRLKTRNTAASRIFYDWPLCIS